MGDDILLQKIIDYGSAEMDYDTRYGNWVVFDKQDGMCYENFVDALDEFVILVHLQVG